MGRSTVNSTTYYNDQETAMVEYENERDAAKAIEEYNGNIVINKLISDAELDGKNLKVRYANEDDVPKQKHNRLIKKY